jgi:hypothetical protein
MVDKQIKKSFRKLKKAIDEQEAIILKADKKADKARKLRKL